VYVYGCLELGQSKERGKEVENIENGEDCYGFSKIIPIFWHFSMANNFSSSLMEWRHASRIPLCATKYYCFVHLHSCITLHHPAHSHCWRMKMKPISSDGLTFPCLQEG